MVVVKTLVFKVLYGVMAFGDVIFTPPLGVSHAAIHKRNTRPEKYLSLVSRGLAAYPIERNWIKLKLGTGGGGAGGILKQTRGHTPIYPLRVMVAFILKPLSTGIC